MSERQKILNQAKELSKLSLEGINKRALIFRVLRENLQNNMLLQEEQNARYTEKKDSFLVSQQHKEIIKKIENNEILLEVYQPDYININKKFREAYSRDKKELPKEDITTKEQFLTLLQHSDYQDYLLKSLGDDFRQKLKQVLTGLSLQIIENNTLHNNFQEHILEKYGDDFLQEVKQTMAKYGEKIIENNILHIEKYTFKENPLLTQKLFWGIRGSPGKKNDGDTSTRITINPINLLNNFDFKTIILAQRWSTKNNTVKLPTTSELFTSTNGHLNGPSI